MTISILLNRTTRSASMPPADAIDGHDMTDWSIVEVADDFSWVGKCVDWDTLQIIDDMPTLRADKWELIKTKRADVLLLAATPFGTFDADEVSKSNVAGQVSALAEMERLGMTVPAIIYWRLADQSMAELTPIQFRTAALLIAKHVSDTYAASWVLEAALNAATTASDIVAIDIDAGWLS